ncbi:MAG TPA: PHP domain-containing protein, partial [Myxococcota bacterium]|nr:PHP domain-containing protein [Myxococcota bacterium]
MYVPLWVKSNYSFLEGASHPDELLEQAHSMGLPALAITDRDGVYGMVRAHVVARELGIKLLVGAQITVGEGGSTVVALAQTRQGYGNLCQLLSRGQMRCPKGVAYVTLHELCDIGEGVLLLCSYPPWLEPLQRAVR